MKVNRKEFGCSPLGAIGLMIGCPGCFTAGNGLRYACKGELHKDFHASIMDGVNYLIDNYGEDAAREVLTTTAHQVYRTMHLKKRGIDRGLRTCWATRVLNDALCQGYPFEIVLEETGDASCRQVLSKKG